MDPILEEMQRVKNPHDMKESRYRDWVTYLCALVARKDDEIATLTRRVGELELASGVEMTAMEILDAAKKRGPSRPRRAQAIHNPDVPLCSNCGQAWDAHGPTSGGIYVQCPTAAGGHV